MIYCIQDTDFILKDTHWVKEKKISRDGYPNIKVDFKNSIKRQGKSLYNIKGSIYQEDITIVNIYVPNIREPKCIKQS